jgi:hypothetical protein
MNRPEQTVKCATHGTRDATYVCRHLASGVVGSGFHLGVDPEEPDELWPVAWCDACERVFDSEGEWNARTEAFLRIRLLCDACYQTVRERNWMQDDDAFDALLRDATTYMQARQDDLQAQYPLARYQRYDRNLETCQLVFSDDGQPRVVADVQLVGSISTRNDTWLWSWANPSVLEPARHQVREVRAYGDERHYMKLACAGWSGDEVDGWEMTSIAAYLLGAKGAYRTQDEGGFSFFVLTDVGWAQ